MSRRLWLTACIPLAVAMGCGESPPAKAPEKSAQEAPAQAAVAQEEGMCKEHGVLEALCTKCNPKLAAIFQAKGDWCAEHGFPESICPVCHPERGGKPAMDVSTDEAPADGTLVILKTMDTARLAGITTTKALPGKGKAVVVAPATVVYDPARVAQVSARAPGVVKRVLVDVGTRVSAGAPLAEIESAAVTGDQSRLGAARSRLRMTEANYRREAELEKKGISAKKDVLAAQQEHQDALAELQALQASLRGMGASGSGGRYTLKAPVAGVVTQRTVTLESYVEPQTPLFEIVDTSVLWGELALPEADLGRVKTGLPVVLKIDGLEGHEFKGTLSYISPAVDPQTRTAKARVRLANPEGLLRANMFGQGRIEVGTSGGSVAIPREAVQRAKTVKLAFVRKAQNEFEARRIELAAPPVKGELVEIASGLEAGEEIAVAGSYFLKTETLKDAIGAGCCGEE